MEHKKSGLGPVLLVLAISGAEMGWIYAVFRWLSLHGRLASHVRPEQSLGPLIFQDFWATLSWAAIIGAFLWIHRGTAREKLALTLPEGKKRWIVWISAGIYALALAAALFVGKPPALTGYLWLFYLIAVAGGEEGSRPTVGAVGAAQRDVRAASCAHGAGRRPNGRTGLRGLPFDTDAGPYCGWHAV